MGCWMDYKDGKIGEVLIRILRILTVWILVRYWKEFKKITGIKSWIEVWGNGECKLKRNVNKEMGEIVNMNKMNQKEITVTRLRATHRE